MAIEAKLTGQEVLQIIEPPESITDMEAYRAHVKAVIFAAAVAEPKREPGRPLKHIHPCYSEDEWRAIKEWLKGKCKTDYRCHILPSGQKTKEARGAAVEQPNDENDFYLDNGVIYNTVFRIRFNEDGSVDDDDFPTGHGGMWK